MKGLEPQSPSHRSRLVAGLVLGIAAIVLAGVRGPATAAPGQDSVLVLDPGAPAVAPVQAAASTRDDALALVSEMTDMVLVIQPAELLAQPGARESLDKSGLRATFGQQLGMPVEEVELVVVLWFDHPGSPKGEGSPVPQPAAMLLRSAKPFDWKALTNHGAGPEQELAFGGHGYTRQGGEGGWSKSRLDDRTVVIGNEPAVLRYLAQRQRPPRGHSWDEAAKRVGPGPVFFATNNTWMVERLQPMADGLGSATMAMVAPLWSEAFAHALSLDAKDGITFDAVSVSGNEAAAGRVADTVRALVTLGRNSLRSVKVQADGGGPSVAGDQS